MKSTATDDPHELATRCYKNLQASTSLLHPQMSCCSSPSILRPGPKHVQACVTIVGMLLDAGRNWGLFSEY